MKRKKGQKKSLPKISPKPVANVDKVRAHVGRLTVGTSVSQLLST